VTQAIDEYVTKSFSLPPGDGRRLLDIGCNWGRSTIAAASAGSAATRLAR